MVLIGGIKPEITSALERILFIIPRFYRIFPDFVACMLKKGVFLNFNFVFNSRNICATYFVVPIPRDFKHISYQDL